MLLTGRDGSELELRIVGYQFPGVRDDPWDSNSLEVAVRVMSPAGAWATIDPCLTTYEAGALVRWLELVAGETPPDRFVRFSEPNFSLAIVVADPTHVRLRARFDFEDRPPWAHDDLGVELDVPRAGLRAAADQLRAELERHPSRADPPE